MEKNKKDALQHIKGMGLSTLGEAINALRAMLENIAKDCQEAGKLYAAICDGYTSGRRAVKDAIADIPDKSWDLLENIGRGHMDHRLFFGIGNATAALMRLPADRQAGVITQGVTVYLPDRTTAIKQARALTTAEVRQVFDSGRIRTEEEQRAWMERQKAMPARRPTAPPIKNDAPMPADEVSVSDGVVTITAGIRVVSMPVAKFARQVGPSVLAAMMQEAVK
jgi:hypothetical protein